MAAETFFNGSDSDEHRWVGRGRVSRNTYLLVVLLSDGLTLHNAFFDRGADVSRLVVAGIAA